MLFQDSSSSGGGLFSFLPLIIIAGVFYLMVFRPQSKERQRVERETKDMLE